MTRILCWLGFHHFDIKNPKTPSGLVYENGHTVGHRYICLWCYERLKKKGIRFWKSDEVGEKIILLKENSVE